MTNASFIRRENCPACHGRESRRLCTHRFDEAPLRDYLQRAYAAVGHGIEWTYLADAQYTLAECATCGLVFQEEIPGDELMAILYGKWIDPAITFANHERDDDTRRYALSAQEILQLIVHFGQPPARLAFMDFGMGWGKWARLARAFGCDCAGVEVSAARIEYAQAAGIPTLTWEEIPRHQFDFINADQVFEHIARPLETLVHLRQALKHGGILKISVPDGGDIKRRLKIGDWMAAKGSRNSLNPVAPLEHINCFNRHALLHLGRQAGLTPMKIPLSTQLTCTVNWGSLRSVARNIVIPIQRDVFGRGTTILFKVN